MTPTIPKNYYFHMTCRCNYSCIYCYNRHNRWDRFWMKELTTGEYFRYLKELLVYSPAKITLTGGEPLLRDDLKTITEYLLRTSPNPVFLSLNTNGSKVDANNVKWLVESFDEISVSMDGFRSINDIMRGSGAFDRALKAVSMICDAGGIPSISITRTSLNNTQIEGFIGYMQHEWGIRSFRINEVKMIGRAKKSPWLYSGNCSCEKAKDASPHSNDSCFIGQKCFEQTMNILPNGDCYPCHYLQESSYYLGNVRKNPISDIFQRMNDMKNAYITS